MEVVHKEVGGLPRDPSKWTKRSVSQSLRYVGIELHLKMPKGQGQ